MSQQDRPLGKGGGDPVKIDQGVERVFVGIPDVFTTEQVARLQGASLVKEAFMLRRDEDGHYDMEDWIGKADALASYILDGRSATVE